jgi:hypothetical protein
MCKFNWEEVRDDGLAFGATPFPNLAYGDIFFGSPSFQLGFSLLLLSPRCFAISFGSAFSLWFAP